tara:strand:- start:3051 stop:3239 length:189 start_codon:yes stop_codon:yes gene_type:complete
MRHLKDSNMGYWLHLSFALRLSVQLVAMAIVGVVHAIIPFFFQNSVSAGIKQMDAKLQEIAN